MLAQQFSENPLVNGVKSKLRKEHSVATSKSVKFIDDTLSSGEATQMISALIDKQINFYKMQYLSNWEKDHTLTTASLDATIESLLQKKSELQRMIAVAHEEGNEVALDATFEIRINK